MTEAPAGRSGDRPGEAAIVSVRRAEPHLESVTARLDEILEESSIYGALSRSSRVLLKVNCVCDRLVFGATTSPTLVDALLRLLKPRCEAVAVADCDDIFHSVEKGFARTGLEEVCRRHQVPLINLTRRTFEPCVMQSPPHAVFFLPDILREYPEVLSVPVMKTHMYTVVTGAVKNLFGFLEYERAMHHQYIGALLGEVLRLVRPVGAIMDGLIAMEGKGPIMGTAVPLGLIVGGNNLLAVDEVMCCLMGLDSETVPHLQECRQSGGSPGDYEVRGQVEPLPSTPFRTPAKGLPFRLSDFGLRHPLARFLLWGNSPLWTLEKALLHLRKNVLWYNLVGRPRNRQLERSNGFAKLWASYLDDSPSCPWWDLALWPLGAPAALRKRRLTRSGTTGTVTHFSTPETCREAHEPLVGE